MTVFNFIKMENKMTQRALVFLWQMKRALSILDYFIFCQQNVKSTVNVLLCVAYKTTRSNKLALVFTFDLYHWFTFYFSFFFSSDGVRVWHINRTDLKSVFDFGFYVNINFYLHYTWVVCCYSRTLSLTRPISKTVSIDDVVEKKKLRK